MSTALPPGVTPEISDEFKYFLPKLATALNHDEAVKSAFAHAKAGLLSLEEFMEIAARSMDKQQG